MIIEQYKVESESDPGRYYIVSRVELAAKCGEVSPVEQWQCSCTGWTRHVPRRDCKHIAYHKAFGGVPVDPLLMAMLKSNRKTERKLKEAA